MLYIDFMCNVSYDQYILNYRYYVSEYPKSQKRTLVLKISEPRKPIPM
jgi:hypothetical protein